MGHSRNHGLRPCSSLLDLPGAWLLFWLQSRYLDGSSKRAIACTCSQLRDLALRGHPGSMWLCFNLPPKPSPAMYRMKQLVLQKAKAITLEVHDLLQESLSLDSMQALHNTLMIHTQKLSNPLTNVTRVTIQFHNVSCMVPNTLLSACPNLRYVMVGAVRCFFKPTPLPSCAPVHTKLRYLELQYGDTFSADGTAMYAAVEDLRQLLPRLPALSRLKLDADKWTDPQVFWTGLASFKPQLTPFMPMPTARNGLHPPPGQAGFLFLKHLHLPQCHIDDQIMMMLAGMTTLTNVTVLSMQLNINHKRCRCGWKQLHVRQFMHLATMAHLPSHHLQQLQLGCWTQSSQFLVQVGNDSSPFAAAAVQEIARMDCVDLGVWALRLEFSLGAERACIATLPCLYYIGGVMKKLQLWLPHITPAICKALSENLPPSITTLELDNSRATWADGALRMLLPSLPASIKEVHLHPSSLNINLINQNGGPCLSWIAVLAICRTTTRPITVVIHTAAAKTPPVSWQQARAVVGHSHVKLKLYEDGELLPFP